MAHYTHASPATCSVADLTARMSHAMCAHSGLRGQYDATLYLISYVISQLPLVPRSLLTLIPLKTVIFHQIYWLAIMPCTIDLNLYHFGTL